MNYIHSFLLMGLASTMFVDATVSPAPSTTQTKEKANEEVVIPYKEYWAAWMIEALKAADEYVKLIDQGRFADTWSRSARISQFTITQKEWSTALDMVRKKLGRVRSRTLKDERPAVDPKGLPKGPYMVVIYNTAFERDPHVNELLTLMRESDGKWRVLTYELTK